jgi:hypothetical protein
MMAKKKITPVVKPTNKPESITDVTRAFLSNIQKKQGKKNRKLRQVKLTKNFKQSKKANMNR